MWFFDETAPVSLGSIFGVAVALCTGACFSEGTVLPGDDASETRDAGDDDDDDDAVTSGDDDDDAVTSGDDDDDADATSDDDDDDDDDATSEDDDATSGDDDDDDDDDDDTSTDDGSTDGGPSECMGLETCPECFACVPGPGEACSPAGAMCAQTPGCMIVSQCLAGCTAGGLCLDDCCIGASDEAVAAAHALDQCQREACVGDPCSDYNDAPCQ